MTTLRGACLCGAVAFAADGPTLFFTHCHCHWCRRAHGAAFVSWVGVKEAAFRLLSGESALRWYQSTAQSRRGFCATCGSTMFFASTAAPGEIHIAAACVEEGLDRKPTSHVFADHAVDWVALSDDLPKVGSDSPKLAAYRAVPGRRS